MPNHLHLIWKQNNMNGKETPQGSFLKYTAPEFLKGLKLKGENHKYAVVVYPFYQPPVSYDLFA